ncbi:hypothetical protein, partial [Streptomyces avermitilis]|uniref:hypothetical protein n=1 Tax=Streptomyces avermitilis TaxID=33903 RepID=UPI003691EF23
MLTETTGRTAQDLAVELAVLRDADWAALWAGAPQSAIDLERWCGRYGWEPRTSDRQLVVRTGNGGELTFDSGGIWGSPVTSVALSHPKPPTRQRATASEFLPGVDVRLVARPAAPLPFSWPRNGAPGPRVRYGCLPPVVGMTWGV